MKNSIEEWGTCILSGVGITGAVSNWNVWLNFVLLIISVLNIIVVAFIKIRRAIKTGDTTELENDTNENIEKIKNDL